MGKRREKMDSVDDMLERAFLPFTENAEAVVSDSEDTDSGDRPTPLLSEPFVPPHSMPVPRAVVPPEPYISPSAPTQPPPPNFEELVIAHATETIPDDMPAHISNPMRAAGLRRPLAPFPHLEDRAAQAAEPLNGVRQDLRRTLLAYLEDFSTPAAEVCHVSNEIVVPYHNGPIDVEFSEDDPEATVSELFRNRDGFENITHYVAMFHELDIELGSLVSCVESFTHGKEELSDSQRVELYEMLFRDITFLFMAHIKGHDKNLQGKLGAYVLNQIPKITQPDRSSEGDLLTDDMTITTLSSLRILLTSTGHHMEAVALYQKFLAHADF